MVLSRKEAMDAARGRTCIDLVLRQARLVNVFAGEIHITDIGIHQGKFVGIGRFPLARREIDLKGKYVTPGLIDGHVHIESSHLCPAEFCSLLVAHGVTTAVTDPHEIANVCGNKGIRYMLDSLAQLPGNFLVVLPSCVPATDLETSGARLEAADLRQFIGHPKVIGLGEMMDYPGVLAAEPGILAKLDLPLSFRDGHAPGIMPEDLNAYYLAGIHTEHECSTPEEARERLRRGFRVMLREGSAAKNLLSLLSAVNAENAGQCLLVTDDRQPTDLLRQGSIDHLVRLAIQAGQPPVRVIQMATINAARAIGLEGLGAVAPGYQADFVILKDLESFAIEAVYWQGQEMSRDAVRPRFTGFNAANLTDSVHLKDWRIEKLAVHAAGADGSIARVRVIGLQKQSLVTSALIRQLPVRAGVIQTDPVQGIAKLAVLERHHGTGRVGVGFVQGFGLVKGAIASTVAHDSHNLVVLGMDDREMELAIRTCVEQGGGLCIVEGERVLGKLALPIAGLMTDDSAENVAQCLEVLHTAARSLGVAPEVDPFMNLAFLSLPVIPELKLTDLGLIDVESFALTTVLV